MNGDISLLGDLWFLLLLLLEGSASAATVCDFHSSPSLSLSLPLQCLSKNINKTPWRECQQDASQGGDTSGEQEQRQVAERWRERERERAGVWYVSILKTSGKCRCWIRGHFIHRLMLNIVFAGAGCLIRPLVVMIKDHWQVPIDGFGPTVTLKIPGCTCYRKSCRDAMCVKWITGRETH